MRSRLAAAVFAAAALSISAAEANVITIGHMTFDFDAPAAPLSAPELRFLQAYKDAVNRRDEAAFMALQDASMTGCTTVGRRLILQNFDKTIPDDAKVRYFAAATNIAEEMGFGDLAYLAAQPTAVLGIIARTGSAQEVKIVTILAPVRSTADAFAFVPYCLTDKGKALLEQKNRTQP
jgi:ABC-type molybdate transport system substrate-binding protein